MVARSKGDLRLVFSENRKTTTIGRFEHERETFESSSTQIDAKSTAPLDGSVQPFHTEKSLRLALRRTSGGCKEVETTYFVAIAQRSKALKIERMNPKDDPGVEVGRARTTE